MLPLDISLTISETIYTVFGRVLERLKGRNIGTKRRSVVGRILDRVPRPHVGLNHWLGRRGGKGGGSGSIFVGLGLGIGWILVKS